MSLSITDLLTPVNRELELPTSPDKLYNPDLPTLAINKASLKASRDKAFSALRLSSIPRNGGDFLLPRTTFDDDPRKDAFLLNGSIDPNVIRKRINPDKAIPSLESGESTLFSTVPSNYTTTNSIGLVQSARKNYVDYKNRFFIEDKANPPKLTDPITGPITQRSKTNKTNASYTVRGEDTSSTIGKILEPFRKTSRKIPQTFQENWLIANKTNDQFRKTVGGYNIAS